MLSIVIIITYTLRYDPWLQNVCISLQAKKIYQDNLNRYINNCHLYLNYPDSTVLKAELMGKGVCVTGDIGAQ